VDSFHYIPNAASTVRDMIPCSPNGTASALRKQYSTLMVENGRAIISAAQGATGAEQCTCQPGAFALASLTLASHHSISAIENAVQQQLSVSNTAQLYAMWGCRACPAGAHCDGNLLPPRARAGYGVLTDSYPVLAAQLDKGHDTFYECAGQQRCPGAQCDCLEGSLLFGTPSGYGPGGIAYNVTRCAEGYLDNSPLCSLCNTTGGWISSLEECVHCDWDDWAYFAISVLVVLTWFPIMALLSETCESLVAHQRSNAGPSHAVHTRRF
jgi:hypothetical protein